MGKIWGQDRHKDIEGWVSLGFPAGLRGPEEEKVRGQFEMSKGACSSGATKLDKEI